MNDENDYKETEMAELNMNEFVSMNVSLIRIISDGRMKFRVNHGRNRYGVTEYTDYDTELEGKQAFLSHVRAALALPEGTY
jgi:hypothetical protein